MKSNTLKVHNLLKNENPKPVSTLIEELKNSSVFTDVLTTKIPQDAVVYQNPIEEWGEEFILRTPDNKYYFLSTGSYEKDDDGLKYYVADDVEHFSGEHQEIFDEWYENVTSEE
jgi:hypothetical protein